jgi:Fe-S oxidoreductase
MEIALAALGVLGLASLVVAAARRYLFTPQGLERSGDATLILGLIAVVLVTSLAGLWYKGRAPALAAGMWWAHMITVLGFLAYLPYSKHLHLLASPFSVLFGALEATGMPPGSDGAARREEFTWRELFSGLACAECGRCERACPASASGAPLSPKKLMHHFKELVRAGPDGKRFLGDVVTHGEIWACTTCYSCMDRCPVFNEHIPLMVEMRRRLVSNGEVDARLQTALTNLTRYGNSFGLSPRNRAKWVQGLEFKIKDARKEPVEYLWFLGDYASFDPRLQPSTQATASLFHRAGLDFGILYEGEQNSGNDGRRAGEEGLFEMLRDKNRQALDKARSERIVTTDPHSYQALKKEYGLDGKVIHYTELLDQLFETGKLTSRNGAAMRATYHDPCYLGRYNGVYEPPRNVLRRAGVDLVEMPRNRADSWCCGAGGGRIWMADMPGVRERPAESRVREAASLNGVETLVVACPKDYVMFEDAVKTAGLEGRLAVKDLAELAEQATRPKEQSA